jgi:hypothetical protein
VCRTALIPPPPPPPHCVGRERFIEELQSEMRSLVAVNRNLMRGRAVGGGGTGGSGEEAGVSALTVASDLKAERNKNRLLKDECARLRDQVGGWVGSVGGGGG